MATFFLITSLRKPPRARHYLKALGEGMMASLMMHNVCWVKTFLNRETIMRKRWDTLFKNKKISIIQPPPKFPVRPRTLDRSILYQTFKTGMKQGEDFIRRQV